MYFIIYVAGCLPYVDVLIDQKDGHAKVFETRAKAERYAKKNCAWEYRIVEF